MDAISKLLETYDDEHLDGLEAAARDGKVNYAFTSHCLLGRHQLGYGGVRHRYGELAWQAEAEYCNIPLSRRNTELLPMVVSEKQRRAWERSVRTLPTPMADEVEAELVAV